MSSLCLLVIIGLKQDGIRLRARRLERPVTDDVSWKNHVTVDTVHGQESGSLTAFPTPPVSPLVVLPYSVRLHVSSPSGIRATLPQPVHRWVWLHEAKGYAPEAPRQKKPLEFLSAPAHPSRAI